MLTVSNPSPPRPHPSLNPPPSPPPPQQNLCSAAWGLAPWWAWVWVRCWCCWPWWISAASSCVTAACSCASHAPYAARRRPPAARARKWRRGRPPTCEFHVFSGLCLRLNQVKSACTGVFGVAGVCVCQSPSSRSIHACGKLAVGVSECQGRRRGYRQCPAFGGAADTLCVLHAPVLSKKMQFYYICMCIHVLGLSNSC